MKKFLGFVIATMMALTACSGVSQKAIDEKIEKDGYDASFSQQEYAFMADYALSHFDESKSSDYMFVLMNADAEGKLDSSNETKCKELQSKAKQYQNNF